MKTDRLIGILSVLLQKEKCTAPELAEKFEVSRRTINRDIEALCKAGIPVCTVQAVSYTHLPQKLFGMFQIGFSRTKKLPS